MIFQYNNKTKIQYVFLSSQKKKKKKHENRYNEILQK